MNLSMRLIKIYHENNYFEVKAARFPPMPTPLNLKNIYIYIYIKKMASPNSPTHLECDPSLLDVVQ